MESLVTKSAKGKDVTTSFKIAEVFGKEHKNVVRDIEALTCSEDFRALNFEHTPYTHPQNKQTYSAYEITKNGFSFLAMGYTGVKASQFKETFIAEFDKREALLTNDDFILSRALTILTDRNKALEAKVSQTTEQLALAESTIKEQAPMVVHYTKVLSAENSHLATAMAQVFGLGAPTFNRLLKEWGIQRRVGSEWVLVAKYLCPEKPLTMTRPVPYLNTAGVQQTKNELRWTEAGREFLVKEFEKHGYKAVA